MGKMASFNTWESESEDKKNVAANGEDEVMENNCLLLTFPQSSQTPLVVSCSCSSIFLHHLPSLQLKPTSHFHVITSHHQSLSFTLTAPKFCKWDSNASRIFNEQNEEVDDEEEESFPGNVKKKRKKWSNQRPPKVNNNNRAAIVFEETVESIFIFKVLKSFGWFLPVIITSLLLSTGIKAFLMTSALYLVLSVLLLAFEKLWGVTHRKPIRKARMRRTESSMKASSVRMEDEEGEKVLYTRQTKMDNPSWVGNGNGSVNKGTQDVPDFGGWDFLDEARPTRETSRVTSESQRTKAEKLSENGRRVTRKSPRTKDEKLSGNGRRSDTPLLLRLLIAVFPFIGFWAKMFW